MGNDARGPAEFVLGLRREHAAILSRISAQRRSVDIIRRAALEEMLRLYDPDWVQPPARFAHLKISDAAVALLVELTGGKPGVGVPYGILIEHMLAEGVAFGKHKRVGSIKRAINSYIRQSGWLDCTADTEGDQAELLKATVSLSKKFFAACAENAKRAKKWGVGK
jgi:hypothetical protein